MKNEKSIFHLVFTIQNSRYSERMKIVGVIKKSSTPLNLDQEIILTQIFKDIIKENHLTCLAYNICGDHIHIILLLDENYIKTIKFIKGKSAYLYNKMNENSNSLWSQKFFIKDLNPWSLDDNNLLNNTITYVKNNRFKHGLSQSQKLNSIIDSFVTYYDFEIDSLKIK